MGENEDFEKECDAYWQKEKNKLESDWYEGDEEIFDPTN